MNLPSIDAATLINAQKKIISDLQHQVLILQLTIEKLHEPKEEPSKE